MRRFILNADDLGLSEGINLGIAKSVKEGLVKSTSVMVNMPEAEKGIELVQESNPNVEINLHINFTLGYPVYEPIEEIESLLDGNGQFLSSSHYKNGGTLSFSYPAIKKEMRAQILRFKELLGDFPVHMETHSVGDQAVGQALYELAAEYDIHANLFYDYQPPKELPYEKTQIPDFAKLMTVLNRGTKLVDFEEDHFGYHDLPEDQVIEFHFHPGYLDQFVLDNSSLTLPRCQDLATLISPELKEWFQEKENKVVNFASLKKN